MAQLIQKGLVDFVGTTESRQYKDKTFVSRVLILEQPRYDNYTGEKLGSNYIKLEATRPELCGELNNFPVGSKVEVEFVVRGTKYAKKDGSGDDVFTHLEMRSIALAGASGVASAPATGGANPIPAAAPIPAPGNAPAPAAPAAAPAPSGPTSDDYDPDLGF